MAKPRAAAIHADVEAHLVSVEAEQQDIQVMPQTDVFRQIPAERPKLRRPRDEQIALHEQNSAFGARNPAMRL